MQKVSYMGDGTTTEFTFNIPYFTNTNIVVTKNGETATGYTIVGTSAGLDADIPYTGGKVVFETAPNTTDCITISRNLPLSRIADYQPTEEIEPTTLNQDLNYLMEIFKDRKEEINELREQYDQITDKEALDTIVARITACHGEITTIGETITTVRAEIAALGDISTLRQTVSDLVTTTGNHTTSIGNLDTRTTGLLDYVIEVQLPTSQNNNVWYRKYKSGWVEQGQNSINCPHNSVQTIELPVAMADNNYIVNAFGTQIDTNGSFGAPSTISGAAKNSTHILLGQQNSSSSSMKIAWEVKGMAASN